MLRNRKKSSIYGVEVVKQLDSFPKLNTDEIIVKSRIGGVVSVIAFLIILWIIIYETRYYYSSSVNFKFVPHGHEDSKLTLNIDITVAMPCQSIGADILDSTNQNVMAFGNLDEEDTWFEMSEEQKAHFEDVRYFNSYMREEFHAINDLLWKSAYSYTYQGMPPRYTVYRKAIPSQAPDACRVFGSLELNKVAGNMHITAGKSFPLPEGHVHLPLFLSETSYNFSHRIHHLSFGDTNQGIIDPLDGDEKIAQHGMTLYQYFIEIVPTDVETFLTKSNTFQFSVKDHMRIVDHDRGSHGVPGIYFKYDVSAMKVIVTQSREPILQFFIRMFSTVAGVFVTAGIFSNLVQFIARKLDFQNLVETKAMNGLEKLIEL